MAESGGFNNLDPAPVDRVAYIHLGRKPKDREIELVDDYEIVTVSRELSRLLSNFDDETTGYISRRAMEKVRYEGDYDHLARFGEWDASSKTSAGDDGMMDDATLAQVVAANPQNSTWLSANAGSGKTRVLTNRVARLLLQGCDPRNILCLTYTKAAASEMQNRLFQTLGDWAMQSDTGLREALEKMGETPPEDLSRARTLFARAIEVPGGLRIQTIHALCASILRQFPLEGGVSPQFRELDDASRNALIEDVLDGLAVRRPAALSEVSVFYSDENLVGLGRMVSSKADDFVITRSRGDIFRKFGVPENLTIEAILESVFAAGDRDMLRTIGTALWQSDKTTDHKTAERMQAAVEMRPHDLLLLSRRLPFDGRERKDAFLCKDRLLAHQFRQGAARSCSTSRSTQRFDAACGRRAARPDRHGRRGKDRRDPSIRTSLPASLRKGKAGSGCVGF